MDLERMTIILLLCVIVLLIGVWYQLHSLNITIKSWMETPAPPVEDDAPEILLADEVLEATPHRIDDTVGTFKGPTPWT